MPYARVKETAVPKRARKSESKFEGTPEWKGMSADLARGLKPKEALQITLTEGDYERIGISNRRTVARFVQRHLDKTGLPYRVKSFHANGLDFIVVSQV